MKKIKDITASKINDIKLFQLSSFKDGRGFFRETFNEEVELMLGEKINFIQDNESFSEYGVLRGMHFQKSPFEQSKLVRVSYGEIQDVIVDLRESSKTYGQWESFKLSSKNNKVLFVPKGFAHGFLVLSKEAVVNYKVDNYYKSEFESGVHFKDRVLGIKWELPEQNIVVSKKDQELPPF